MDLPARLRVEPSGAVGQVVTGDPGYRGVAQAHRRDRSGHPARLVGVQRRWLAGVDLAEVTAPGAPVAADQEGGLAVLPAFEDVRQPASSHTVCRPSRPTSFLSAKYSGPVRSRAFIH